MTIPSKAQERYGAAFLIALTNPQDESAGAIDATRMNQAEADVKGYFRLWANEEYDETKEQHVAVAVKCLVTLLQIYTGQAGGSVDDLYKTMESDLRAVAKIGSRDRILVTSTSQLQPVPEQAQGMDPPRPDSDRSYFNDLVPGPLSSDDPRFTRR